MPRADGFAGERISVLPGPLVEDALGQPLTSRLLVTDCGYFPAASDHQRSRPHGSRQTIVIICTDGRGWCRLPSGLYRVRPGQALVIPSGLAHVYGATASHPWTIWWLHVTGVDVVELVRAARVGPDRPVIEVGDVYRAVSLVDDALRRMEHDDSVRGRRAASGSAWHLLALLAADRTDAPATSGDAIRQAQQHLQEHVGSRISVADLAAMAGLSTSHFAALFRRATGVGVLEYQTRLRMSRARELLDKTDLPINAVAHRLGYGDPFYFSRQFRSIHDITATRYRAQHKG